MEENRINGYTLPLVNFKKQTRDKVDIYYSISNTNSDTFDYAETLSCFFKSNTPIIYIHWAETPIIYRYRGLTKETIKKFCDFESITGIVLAEPGFIRTPAKIFKETKPGEQISIIQEYNYTDILYRPYKLSNSDREEFAKQAYFMESIGFRDTGYKSVCGNNIFMYRSELTREYITRILMDEIYF